MVNRIPFGDNTLGREECCALVVFALRPTGDRQKVCGREWTKGGLRGHIKVVERFKSRAEEWLAAPFPQHGRERQDAERSRVIYKILIVFLIILATPGTPQNGRRVATLMIHNRVLVQAKGRGTHAT